MARNGLTQRQKWYFSGTSQGVNQSATLIKASNGAIAQLGEHLLCKQGVAATKPPVISRVAPEENQAAIRVFSG